MNRFWLVTKEPRIKICDSCGENISKYKTAWLTIDGDACCSDVCAEASVALALEELERDMWPDVDNESPVMEFI